MIGPVPVRLWGCVAALVGSLLPLGCTTRVAGTIPPSQFQFRTTVPLGGEKVGGWQAAQVIITLGSKYGVAVCRIEVGTPLVNEVEGVISVEAAQVAASRAADIAARVALARPRLSAELCRAFIDEMNVQLIDIIDGARVSAFTSDGLTPTKWP